MTMTRDEASKLRSDAIAKAKKLDIGTMMFVILDIGRLQIPPERNGETVPGKTTRAIPKSGYVMYGEKYATNSYVLTVASADNPTDRVLRYERTPAGFFYQVFRDGPWVSMLEAEYNLIEYNTSDEAIQKIVNNYSPLT